MIDRSINAETAEAGMVAASDGSSCSQIGNSPHQNQLEVICAYLCTTIESFGIFNVFSTFFLASPDSGMGVDNSRNIGGPQFLGHRKH